MKNRFLMTIIAIALCSNSAFAQWKPAGDKIMTKWAQQVDPDNVLNEYPRPLIERTAWVNLNGLWDYAIKPVGQAIPSEYDGQILVPFAIESSLSGVQKSVGVDNELWYKRKFNVPATWKGKNVVLNFGAVDWKCEVYVNDIVIGKHQGGYAPFSFDITPYLTQKGEQTIVLRVYDPTDKGICPRGKQVSDPSGIWYTSVTGIWQTVWIEPVFENHIVSLKTVPNVKANTINFTAEASKFKLGDIVTVEVLDDGKVISVGKGTPGNTICLPISNPKLWTPDTPNLYDVKVKLENGGKVLDEFKSYAAMRSVSRITDSKGFHRIALNGEAIFNFGPLDQGWWPDGLYTAPSDEALAFDIIKTKELGFNMIRKHVKVEPARWYYHCDRLGILVWQDMPSGDFANGVWDPSTINGGRDAQRSQASRNNYYDEWKEIIDLCYSNPSVIVWVPFNEGWGQFDTESVVSWTKSYDPSRLVNPASGGNFRLCGDITDFHHYPFPKISHFDPRRITAIGEYGGIGLPVEGHLWWNKKNWGYVQFKNSDEVTSEYVKYTEMLKDIVRNGISGAVYTQTTDVEGEVNGLMTYDREIMKVNLDKVSEANKSVINSMK